MALLTEPSVLVAIALILLLGATVKGALGVGMPLLSIPLLSLIMSPATAIGLLAAPILASNALQLYETRLFLFALRRIVWLMLFQYVALVWTIQWTTTIDVSELNRWTASSVFLSACLLLFKPQFQIPTSLEVPISILVGLLAGFMGGVSALTGPVVIAYLVALRISREEFIGTISTVYLFSAVPMYLLMIFFERFGWGEIMVSLWALIPMVVGLKLGQRLRHRLSEHRFRQVLLAFLLASSVALFFKQ